VDGLAFVAVLLVGGTIAGLYAVQVFRRPIVAPAGSKGDPLDHERRLLVMEAKQRALEMEWEDTRAKFLGMTRSFIRHAKNAGLKNGDGVDELGDVATPKGPALKRADVLAVWRRKHAQP
jgi:hypothetical protein